MDAPNEGFGPVGAETETSTTDGVNPAGDAGALSRRTALKAGVAAGVGAVAWSGMSITSLGGTPAYAAGCTGVITSSSSPSASILPTSCWSMSIVAP